MKNFVAVLQRQLRAKIIVVPLRSGKWTITVVDSDGEWVERFEIGGADLAATFSMCDADTSSAEEDYQGILDLRAMVAR